MRAHKFHVRPCEDIQIWAPRTKAALEANEVLHAFVIHFMGNGAVKLTAELKISVAKARVVIIEGLGDKLFVCATVGKKTLSRCGSV